MPRSFAAFLFSLLLGCSAFAQVRTLDFFVSSGLQNSPLLKDYSEQLKISAIDSTLIGAQRKPQVDGVSTLMSAPTYKGWGYDLAITNGWNIGVQAVASQEIFANRVYAPQYAALQIQNQSLQNSSKISAHELQKDIVTQYLAAWSSFNQLSYNKNLLKLVRDQEAVLKSLVEQGIYRQTDYLAFELEKQAQEVQVAQLEIQYRADANQLNVLCGIADTSYFEIAAPELTGPLVPPATTSPFLLQFRIDSLRILNARTLIDTRYRPHLGWFADAGLLSSTPASFYRNFGFSFGLSFSVPIYDGKRRGMEYQKLSISETIRSNYRQFFSAQQQMQVSQYTFQLAATERLIVQQKNLLNTSQLLVDANKQLLNKGQASVTEFILAVKNNLDIQNQLNQSEITRLQLINQLNYWNW